MNNNKKTVTIFGTSRVKDGDKVFELAYEPGEKKRLVYVS
jgi:hypothetical protein